MNIEDLKKQIINANKAYRDGHPIIDDQTFDNLCEELEKLISNDEYAEFRDSLNESIIENGEKIKHTYVMGSLDKIKNSDESSLKKFINSYVHHKLNVSAKVDGISSVAKYIDGKLVSFASRGDGYEGMSFINKAPYIKNLPKEIDFKDEIFIRGELVICNDEQIDSATNLRNICAGWMNSKTWNKDDISKISFVPYTILGSKYTKDQQFNLMKSLGFNVVWNVNVDINQENLSEILNEYAHKEHQYSCDGLVLIDNEAYNEQDVYRPKNSVAWKINELVGITRIIDVDWSSVSKDGFICPIFILDPIVLGGATISRASASNLDIIEKLDARYGSVVEICKANDIIPHINRVIDNTNTSPIKIPTECPCCGSKLIRDGINMRCINKECSDQVVTQLSHFIKKLGVKSASNATLMNFGITSFEKLISFIPNKKYKSEIKLYDELYNKVFSQSKEKLLTAMNFIGLSEILIGKIIDHYGYDLIESDNFKNEAYKSLPNGIGTITLDKFIENLPEALVQVNMVINDIRWHYIRSDSNASRNKVAIKGSICVTGSLKFGSRSKFLEFAKEHGYESKSGVSKGLTYLINNDITSNSSKNRKAKELGIQIISENDFMKIINNSIFESSISSL